MKQLIPNFIQQKFEQFQFNGHLEANVLFIDLSGFTPLTETLMDKGASGAEELSIILNQIFEPLVGMVYSRGGIIPYFAGDAFLAVFPDNDRKSAQAAAHNLFEAALAIRGYFLGRAYTFGDFTIGLKIGLSAGKVEWGIVGRDKRSFYFRGEPIRASSLSQERAKKETYSIILDDTIHKNLETKLTKQLETIEEGFYYVKQSYQPPIIPFISVQMPNLNRAIASQFLPDSVLQYSQDGEFRTVISVFISFTGIDNHRLLNRFANVVLEQIYNFSGYFKEIEFGDKGGVMVGFFGAPVSFENNSARALEFISAISQELQGLQEGYGLRYRVGMTTGMAYTGIVGGKERCQYAAVGNRVNLAARLMTYADWGEVLVDTEIHKNRNFHFHPKGLIKYKGIPGPVATFKLLGRKDTNQSDYEGKLIGREPEMTQLIDFTEPLFNIKPAGIIFLFGEAGIGKSRLSYELKKALLSTGRVQWFHCQTDQILRKSFNPFIFFLRNYFNQSVEDSMDDNLERFESRFQELYENLTQKEDALIEEHIKELLRTKSILAALIGIMYFDSLWEQLDARGRYQNTILAIINLFLCEASIEPLVIDVEDGHWLEGNSLELLQELVRQIKDYPISLILTSRYSDNGAKPVFFDLDTLNNLQTKTLEINLNYLSNSAVRELAEHQLKSPITDRFFELLKRTTNSNPFYLQQLLEYFEEQDLLTLKDKKYTLINEDIQLSDSINSILTARIDRLSALVKETVKAAAVIGREFDVPVLREVMKTNEAFLNTNEVAEPLLREQVKIAEQGQIWLALSDLRYIFKYSLLREAAYSMQLRTRLQTIHQMIAEAIEKIYVDKIEERYEDLAFHYQKADIFDKTCEYLRKAADYARNNYQNQRALTYYEKLLEKLNDQAASGKQIKTYLKKGKVLELIGEWGQSEASYQEALRLAKLDRDALLLGEAHNRLGNVMLLKGAYLEGKKFLLAAEHLFKSIDDKNGIADVKGNLGNLYFRQGKYTQAKKNFLESIKLTQSIGTRLVNPQIVSNLGLTYMNQGAYEAGIKVQQKHLDVYEQHKDKPGMATVYTFMGIVYLEKGDHDLALDSFQKGLVLNTELGNKHLKAIAIGNIGIVYERKGDYTEAMKHYIQDLELVEELGDKQGTAIALGLIGQLLNIQGEFYRAIEYLQKDLMICEELGYQKGIGKALNTLGDIFYYLHQYPRSVDFYDRAITVTRSIGNKLVLGLSLVEKGNVVLALGDQKELKKLVTEALQIAEELGNPDFRFEAELLQTKYLILLDQKEEAQAKLEKLLKTSKGIDQEAPIYFGLTQILPEDGHLRSKALELYQKLYQDTPKFAYQHHIDLLLGK